ncbi:MAG TPA: patatin-like phospholipase family protein, partial [Stellaceae bacterium]|nr:patatin-like phospholipase family protein [Stellaceae bacterium]
MQGRRGRHELSDVLADEFTAIKGDKPDEQSASLATVMAAAASQIDAINLAELDKAKAVERARLGAAYDWASTQRLSALCLSGGGIRSAAFSLGVIQGFADKDLLSKFNYLSTVSGGGYIGSWLSAWLHHSRVLPHK